MVNLELERFGYGKDSTLGRLFVDGEFECFTLEDERREVKVYGETCIPTGTFEILLRKEGGKHKDYLDLFPELHKGMLWLQDVPDFEWVYIHIGNYESQTLGCPLVGNVPAILPDGEFQVLRSSDAYKALYRKLVGRLEAGERVVLHIREV